MKETRQQLLDRVWREKRAGLKHGDVTTRESGMRVRTVCDIRLEFVHPPIPDRNHDWRATRSGYDEGDPMGYGPTPEAALTDLLEQELDRG